MQSPALALGWQLWRRNRWGAYASGAVWLVLTVLSHALTAAGLSGQTLFSSIAALLAAMAIFPLIAFTYSPEARIDARESGFPARLLTLPLRTRTLVFWPMLFGAVTMAGLWLAIAFGILRPCGLRPALLWPALLAAAGLACLQALVWFPVPLPWLRALAIFAMWPIVIVATVIVVDHDVPEGIVVGVLALLLPAAYAVALAGVARARRGDLPQWAWWPRLVAAVTRLRWGGRARFASIGGALDWLERRRRGRPLVFFTAWCILLIPLWPALEWVLALMASLPADFPGHAAAVRELGIPGVLLLSLLAVPPVLATATGDLGRLNSDGQAFEISSFLAARPVTSAALAFAKFRLAAWNALASWAILLPVAAVCFFIGGRAGQTADSEFVRRWGAVGTCGLLALVVVASAGVTWMQMVKGLWTGLTGRPWVFGTVLLLHLPLFLAAVLLISWLNGHPDSRERVYTWMTWLAGVAVVLKLVAARWAFREASRRRLLSGRFLVGLLAAWVSATAGLATLLGVLLPLPLTLITLGVVLFVPLSRLAAAPLAVEWNRHR